MASLYGQANAIQEVSVKSSQIQQQFAALEAEIDQLKSATERLTGELQAVVFYGPETNAKEPNDSPSMCHVAERIFSSRRSVEAVHRQLTTLTNALQL